MVASHLRLPRVYPLPRKAVSHSNFKALLEKRRQSLELLVVLLKARARREEERGVTENGGAERESSGKREEEFTTEMSDGKVSMEADEQRLPALDGGLAETSGKSEAGFGDRSPKPSAQRSDEQDEPKDEGLQSNEREASGEERGGTEKAELEEKLNKLESKKHMLVQQLKQVLVREDSRKFLRPPLAPSPMPSPSSLALASSYYLPNPSPLPSTSSSPLTTPTPQIQRSDSQRRNDDALEEGELPEGGSPVTSAKEQSEPDRSQGDWERGLERGKLMHSASWDQRNSDRFYRSDDHFYHGRERPLVSPKGSYGGRMGPSYHHPLTLRRNFSLGLTGSAQSRFPLRTNGLGLGLEGAISPQESLPTPQFVDAVGALSPTNGHAAFQSRSRDKAT